MKAASATCTALEEERLRLLRRLDVPAVDATLPGDDPLAAGDRATLRRLLGHPLERWESGLCPLAAGPVLDLLSTTEEGKRERLTADVALIADVLQRRGDVTRVDRFGLTDAAFPVVSADRVIGCLWLRGYRTRPFDEAAVASLAAAAKRPPAEVRPLAEACPRVDRGQENRMHELTRSCRDAVSEAVREHLEGRGLAAHLLQSERSRALGALSSGVSHRFNNLLSIILGYSSFVLNRERVSPDAREALQKISQAAQQGRRLTEELLAFAGSEVEEATECPVHSMLSSILALLQSQHSSRIRVKTELRAPNDRVTAPPSSIHQLIFHLLSNAFDSLPEGGDVRIRSSVVMQDRDDGPPAPYLSLAVSDASALRTPEQEPARHQGGLHRMRMRWSQARGIVGDLDGAVTVISEPGETTCVEVRLPLTTEPAPRPTRRPDPGESRPAVIWVVDDDDIFRDMCREVLGEAGHDVDTLATGRELLDRWSGAESPPDLLIIDFSMPEFNGLELCTWLKEQGCESPIILVSGFTQTQPDIHRALEFRHTHFLRKPFSFREMMDTVTVALGESLMHSSAVSKPDVPPS